MVVLLSISHVKIVFLKCCAASVKVCCDRVLTSGYSSCLGLACTKDVVLLVFLSICRGPPTEHQNSASREG